MRRAQRSVAGNHETVEDLIRYAAARFATAGVDFHPPRMSKLIRRNLSSLSVARDAIDAYLDDQISDSSWRGFELFVNGVADPTGAHAARNLEPGTHWKDDPQWQAAAT